MSEAIWAVSPSSATDRVLSKGDRDELKRMFEESFDFSWVEVRRSRRGRRVSLRWAGLPTPKDVWSAVTSFGAGRDFDFVFEGQFDEFGFVVPSTVSDAEVPSAGVRVVFAHRPLWSCGAYHLHAGESWVCHVASPAAEDIGESESDECGCWWGSAGVDALVDLVGDVDTARVLFGSGTQVTRGPGFDGDRVFVAVDADLESAAFRLGLSAPAGVCRLGLFHLH